MPENQELLNEQQQTNAGNAIYILGRNTYDSWEDYGNNIFFVRENSSTLSDMVSLYVGQSKQSDVVVATSESDIWDPVTNTYNIPEKYQVSGKLFFIERDIPTYDPNNQDVKMYGTVIWDGEKFVDCGNPNNVIVLTNVDDDIGDLRQWLSQNITGIKDFIYIVPNYHSIYYYDGANGYISIISVDNFVTVEMLNEVASRIPVADELTVLSTVSNSQTVFSSAGADLSNKFVITGSSGSETSEPAGEGATIFNNYDPTPVSGVQGYRYGTTAIGAYSSAFGTGNVTRGSNSVAFGTGNVTSGFNSSTFGSSNTIGTSGSNSSVIGASNTVNGSQSLVVGVSSQLSGSQCLSVGMGNNIQSGTGCVALGMLNTFTGGGMCASIGQFNEITAGSSCISLGDHNNIHAPSQTPYSDTYYDIYSTAIYSAIAIGTNNNVSGHSFKEKVNGSLKDCTNFSNIAIGHGNTISETSNGSIVIGGYKTGNARYEGFENGNTVHTPRSIVIGHSNTLNNTQDSISRSTSTRYNFIIGANNTMGVSGAVAEGVHVFGDHNSIGLNSSISDYSLRTTYVIGSNNSVQLDGSNDTYVFGYENTPLGGDTMLIGHNIRSNGGIVIGTFNDVQTRRGIVLASGWGQGPEGDPFIRFDAVHIHGRDIVVDPDKKTNRSLRSGYGTSLTLGVQILSQQTGTIVDNVLQYGKIPGNNYIASVTWGDTNKLQFLLNSDNKFTYPQPTDVEPYMETSVEVQDVLLESTPDYSCLLVIPKLSSFNSASDIIVNFTANDASKIYLLNPDIDISSYTTIHILLFYDLSNLCAIVSGYQEVTTP